MGDGRTVTGSGVTAHGPLLKVILGLLLSGSRGRFGLRLLQTHHFRSTAPTFPDYGYFHFSCEITRSFIQVPMNYNCPTLNLTIKADTIR